MADDRSFGERWNEARPTKTMLFWSCAGCVALTLILGFTWGGWVTGGTAMAMSEDAAEEARAELASVVCVERFLSSADASAQLASLKEQSSWQRDGFIEDGGWVTLVGMDEPVPDAAELCADKLVEMDIPPVQETAAIAN